MKLQVIALRLEADGIISVTLRSAIDEQLPEWPAGSHIAITLPSGLVRQYSLCGVRGDANTYTVAVLRVDDGRGGSREVHDTVRIGEILEVAAPRNDFALATAVNYLFIAGGIGITPILSMLEQLGAEIGPAPGVRLLYGARTRTAMAFTERLTSCASLLPGVSVDLVAEDESGLPDVAAAIDDCPAGTAVYCCGPPPMLAAVQQLADARPDVTLHIERFTAAATVATVKGGGEFEVELVRSGRTVVVPRGKSVLDVVLEVAPDTAFSCTSGFCGTCETRVLSGEVDHRDELLTERERAANQSMMICVSRSLRGAPLRLDL